MLMFGRTFIKDGQCFKVEFYLQQNKIVDNFVSTNLKLPYLGTIFVLWNVALSGDEQFP